MKIIQPTPQEVKQVNKAFNTSAIGLVVICFTAAFCFAKMEKTSSETKEIEQLKIKKLEVEVRGKEADVQLAMIKIGRMPEYRPIVISDRTIVAGTSYQPSLTRATSVTVSASVSCALTLSGGAAGSIALATSPDNVTFTTKAQILNSSTGSLVIGVAITNINGSPLTCTVPVGYYYKLITTTTTGTPVFAVLTTSQETNL